MFSVQRHSCAYCDKPIQWPKIVNVTLLSPQKTSPTLQQRRKTFRERRSLEMRKMESLEVRTKFPKKIPVIVEKSDREKVLPYLDRVKFLVPLDMTMSQFVGIVRARLKLKPTQTVQAGGWIPLRHLCGSRDVRVASTQMHNRTVSSGTIWSCSKADAIDSADHED
ncbi:hypothetical protein TNCT_256361 [Trichonephila clavata]|uniref:Autophagy-related protein n=1 Tax=Trichonephila clavata TaxID=2740835 RepID=A0A8X6LHQ5_TRICU|nr:hypothetical protein TNCT_256361 [Trichonephila clavata]